MPRGRFQRAWLACGLSNPILVSNIYGFTNGDAKPDLAAATDEIIHRTMVEMAAQPPGVKLIVGGVNCSMRCLPSVNDQLTAGGWCDLGAPARLDDPSGRGHLQDARLRRILGEGLLSGQRRAHPVE